MLKGPRGTVVRIKVLRFGQAQLLPFDITRDKIPMYSVDVDYMVNENTGYIKINTFAMTTFDEFMKGLRELKSKGMTKLILDLRGNSGGIMEAAIQIANQFLKENQLIVYTKGRSPAKKRGKGQQEKENLKPRDLVILIDEWKRLQPVRSLPALFRIMTEEPLSAGVPLVKDWFRNQYPFSDGSGMRLTIARYYTPTGRSIQKLIQ